MDAWVSEQMSEYALVRGWSLVHSSYHVVVCVGTGEQLVACVIIWVRVNEPELKGRQWGE